VSEVIDARVKAASIECGIVGLRNFIKLSNDGERHLQERRSLDPEDEATWLHHHVMRLRTALRYARARQAEAILREMIAAAETRLDAITNAHLKGSS
jgi:hypothetical protein